VGHHSDFWPGNVYLSEDSVQAIDFEGYREGLPAEDPAYFLVHLAAYFAYPGLGGRGRRAEAAFLAGWLDGDPLDRAALELCRTAKALQVLARAGGTAAGWQERRRRRALVALLRRSGAER
jgi:hypothetical protein